MAFTMKQLFFLLASTLLLLFGLTEAAERASFCDLGGKILQRSPKMSTFARGVKLMSSKLYLTFNQTLDFIEQGLHDTDGIIHVHEPRRFLLPNSTIPLHCQLQYNWIDTENPQWVAKYRNVTNMLAAKINATLHLVCYFVDAANAREADCLKDFVQNEDLFPWTETIDRSTTWNESQLDPPGQLLTGVYCNLRCKGKSGAISYRELKQQERQQMAIFSYSVLAIILLLVVLVSVGLVRYKIKQTKANWLDYGHDTVEPIFVETGDNLKFVADGTCTKQ